MIFAQCRRVLSIACLVGALAGCSSTVTGSGHQSSAATTRPSGASASAPSPTHSAATAASQLEALLITTVPPGYVRQPDSVGDTGPSDLAKAERDDGHADAPHALTADGFEIGYQRLWATSAGAQLIDFLYKFRSTTGARAYFARSLRLDEQSAASQTHLRHFTVTGVPSSVGLYGSADGRSVAVVLAPIGTYLVEINANSTTSAGLEARAATVMREQRARL